MENPALADDLQREYDALADRRSFGLNFERHVPEAVELPGRKVRKGDKVRVLPERGQSATAENDRLWRVTAIGTESGVRRASVVSLDDTENEASVPVDDLVVVAEFRDPIYPGLVSTGKIERGGDKPFHTVINAENFHALQTLLFTHRGKVDCIYIDPPYNTGASDWKYNNNYIEKDDLYRHSKWLAMIERRMLMARQLLNPLDSVLLVTIDEKEYLRLGLLLQQIFPEAQIQMITSVISRNGTSREGEFSRVEEFIYIVRLGRQAIVRTNDNMLSEEGASAVSRIWFSFMRTSTPRTALEGQFYPIVIDTRTRRVLRIGDPPGRGRPALDPYLIDGEVAVWPIRQDGGTATWGAIVPTARELLRDGYIRVGGFDERSNRWSIHFVREGDRERVSAGVIREIGVRPDGSKELEYADLTKRESYPKTVWNRVSHDATSHGTRLLKELLPGRRFPYPKSLYAVEDVLRFFVKEKPNAIILDFFAGSGTTAHAVARLNRQDNHRRQAILVTNNEVAAEEQRALHSDGLRPGDPEWERHGICNHITMPRVAAAITGRTPDGSKVKGDYKFVDEFPIADGLEENVEFFTLTYEAPLRVASNREFTKIAPLLWMRAGSRGRRIDDISAGWDVAEAYGVIADLDQSETFVKAVASDDDVAMAFIVTDEDWLFEALVAQLPDHVEPVRLYEAYLRNFEIEAGRSAR